MISAAPSSMTISPNASAVPSGRLTSDVAPARLADTSSAPPPAAGKRGDRDTEGDGEGSGGVAGFIRA